MRLALLTWIALAPAWPQTGLPRELLLLTRAKRHMAEALSQVPNYTCLETVQRLRRNKPSAPLKIQDTVRFEVAHVDHRELFAPPGAPAFEESNPAALVGSGMMGTGMFAGFDRSVFLGSQTTFQYRGEQDLNGRQLLRYDYRIGTIASDWSVYAGGVSGKVSTKGSIWLDPRTLDLVRLEADADEIPPNLPVESVRTTIDYARAQVSASPALLPQSGELLLTDMGGGEAVNRVEFTHCRAYQSESTVSFGPLPPPETRRLGSILDAVPRPEPDSLPPGLLLPLQLLTPIDSATEVPGSAIQARIEADVRVKGQLLVAAGTLVRGRLRRMEYYAQPQPYWAVGLEFTEIETPGGRVRFFAGLVRVEHPPAGLRTLADGRAEPETIRDLPGVGTLFLEGAAFQLPAGTHLVWKTRALR